MSVTLFMATLGNGLVTSNVSAGKGRSGMISFENRNNRAEGRGTT